MPRDDSGTRALRHSAGRSRVSASQRACDPSTSMWATSPRSTMAWSAAVRAPRSKRGKVM